MGLDKKESKQKNEIIELDYFKKSTSETIYFLKKVFDASLAGRNTNFNKAFESGDMSDYQLHKKGREEGNNTGDYNELKDLLNIRNEYFLKIMVVLIDEEKFTRVKSDENKISIDITKKEYGEIPDLLSLRKSHKIIAKKKFKDVEAKKLLTQEEFENLMDFFYGNIEVLKYLLGIDSEYIWLKEGKIGHIGNNKNSGRVQSNVKFNKKTFNLPFVEKV